MKFINNPNDCQITHAMNIVGNKWVSIIVYTLSDKSLRFGEIDARIERLSRKVLTDQLREMEHKGIVSRKSYAETPPRVQYSLTAKGKELIPILNQLCQWSKEIKVEERL